MFLCLVTLVPPTSDSNCHAKYMLITGYLLLFVTEKLEEALVSNSPDTILYGVIKFLLQTIFAAMEEEHESLVEVSQKQKQVNSQETEPEEREESISSHSRTGLLVDDYLHTHKDTVNIYCIIPLKRTARLYVD